MSFARPYADGFAADLVGMPDFQPMLHRTALGLRGRAALTILTHALSRPTVNHQSESEIALAVASLPTDLATLARFCPETTDPWTARALTEADSLDSSPSCLVAGSISRGFADDASRLEQLQ